MIKSIEQCEAIQKRRAAAGRRGYAKAVRRYLLREYSGIYAAMRDKLPPLWDAKHS